MDCRQRSSIGSPDIVRRREFCLGLGAAFASCVLPGTPGHAELEPAVCSTDPDTRIRIIDCAYDVTRQAELIREAGISTVVRYYAREGGQWCGKALSSEELTALENAGLSVAVIFQHNNNNARAFYDSAKKIGDVEWALHHAKCLSQPKGTPIYFGADFDLAYRAKLDSKGKVITAKGRDGKRRPVLETTPEICKANEDALLDYFRHARECLAEEGYKIGVYGCGATCELLAGPAPLVDFFWLSGSVAYLGTSKFYNDMRWHLFQNKIERRRPYAPTECTLRMHSMASCDNATAGKTEPINPNHQVIDTNLLNPRFGDFGQWQRSGPAGEHASDASTKLLLSRAFVRNAEAPVYASRDGRPGPQLKASRSPVSYARNVRVLCDHGDHVAISEDESDTPVGFCRKTDLTDNMMEMPPWPRMA
jgi:Domain of unknown function (DUF1906)